MYKSKLRSIILIIILVALSAVIIKMVSSLKEEIKPKTIVQATKGVRVNEAMPDVHVAKILFSGKVQAYNRFEIYSEVSGLLKPTKFREGVRFRQNEIILKIESAELENAVIAQRSNFMNIVSGMMGDLSLDFPEYYTEWERFLSKVDVKSNLPELPVIADNKLKVYLAGKQVLNSYWTILSQEERLRKYTIRAPFSGVISQALVKPGTLIRPLQKLGELVNSSRYDLVTEFSLKDKDFVNIGDRVTLHSQDLTKPVEGVVYRINPTINGSSQMITAYVKVESRMVQEGMFFTGIINGSSFTHSYEVDRKLLNGDEIFVVKDDQLTAKKVKILHTNQEKSIISGLDPGDLVLKDNLKGLYPGMKVKVIK